VRGDVAEVIAAAAAEADLVAIGTLGWSIGPRRRFGSTAQKIMAGSVPLLLLPGGVATRPFHFVAYFDDGAHAQRALLFAALLAESRKQGLTVLIGAADDAHAKRLERAALAALAARKLDIRFRRVDPADQTGLRWAMDSERGGILVLGGRGSTHGLAALEALAEGRIPLLLVDDH